MYPLTVSEIATNQRQSKKFRSVFAKQKPPPEISLKIIGDTEVLVYDNHRLVIPNTDMQSCCTNSLFGLLSLGFTYPRTCSTTLPRKTILLLS